MWAGAREEWCYWTDLAAIKFPLTYSFRADMDTSFADSKCASGLRATHMQLIQPTPLTVGTDADRCVSNPSERLDQVSFESPISLRAAVMNGEPKMDATPDE